MGDGYFGDLPGLPKPHNKQSGEPQNTEFQNPQTFRRQSGEPQTVCFNDVIKLTVCLLGDLYLHVTV
jgi:hypothetical protein